MTKELVMLGGIPYGVLINGKVLLLGQDVVKKEWETTPKQFSKEDRKYMNLNEGGE